MAVPSYSESFGLVAVEAQAWNTGGRRGGGWSAGGGDRQPGGSLVDGRSAGLGQSIAAAAGFRRRRLEPCGRRHARRFSWDHTVDGLLSSYGRAMAEFSGIQMRSAARDLASRRAGRRWAMRRGVRVMPKAGGEADPPD